MLYTTKPLEVLPPLYIFDSRAGNLVNFNIEPSWVEGLPDFTGKFGRDKKFIYHSSVDVWKKRVPWMRVLFRLYVEKIVLNTYPNASITIERYYRTGQSPQGEQLFSKFDSDPGRLSRSKIQRWSSGGDCVEPRDLSSYFGLPKSKQRQNQRDGLISYL